MILSEALQAQMLAQIKSLQQVKAFIQLEEGVRAEVYADHKGIATIGVGFNLQRSDAAVILQSICHLHFNPKQKIILNPAQIEKLFEYCLAEATHFIIEKISPPVFQSLQASQQQALISLVYNSKALLGEHLIACVRQQQWAKAAAEIRWCSNKHHDLRLQPRREQEAALMMRDETLK